eukprot:2269753-Rhodomonas_salina.3
MMLLASRTIPHVSTGYALTRRAGVSTRAEKKVSKFSRGMTPMIVITAGPGSTISYSLSSMVAALCRTSHSKPVGGYLQCSHPLHTVRPYAWSVPDFAQQAHSQTPPFATYAYTMLYLCYTANRVASSQADSDMHHVSTGHRVWSA